MKTILGICTALLVQGMCFAAEKTPGEGVGAKSLWKTGTKYEQSRKYEKALDCYRRSLLVAEHARTYYDMGNCLLELKRHQDALKSFNKALKLSDGKQDQEWKNLPPYIYAGMAMVYADMKDTENERVCFEKASARADGNPAIKGEFIATVNYNLGVLYQEKDIEGALKLYHKALVGALADNKVDASLCHKINYALGTMYAQRGDYLKAMEYFKESGELNPFLDHGLHWPQGDRETPDGKPLRTVPDDMS